MNVLHADSMNHALIKGLKLLKSVGTKSKPRGLECVELSDPTTIIYNDPRDNISILRGRRANIFATIYETLWVLSGRTDVESLSYYLPNAKDFSDDGLTWRAGYGRRLMNSHNCVNQLEQVVNELEKDPHSRRAIINIWDVVEESHGYRINSKDFPCSIALHFLLRDNRLDVRFFIRSNDIYFGMSHINLFEWSAVQQLIASMLGVGVGQFHYIASNLHYYEKKEGQIDNILDSNPDYIELSKIPPMAHVTHNFPDSYRQFKNELQFAMDKRTDISYGSTFFNDCALMLVAYDWIKEHEYVMGIETIKRVIHYKWQIAGYNYAHRAFYNYWKGLYSDDKLKDKKFDDDLKLFQEQIKDCMSYYDYLPNGVMDFIYEKGVK